MFKPEELRSQIQITPEEVQTYYNSNKAGFRDPERKDVVVLVADQGKIEEALQISDAELRTAYDRNKDQFRTPERVKVVTSCSRPPTRNRLMSRRSRRKRRMC